MSGSAGGGQPLALALLVYPLLEETVFRWGLLHWADQRFAAYPWRNNVAVSVLFAACHAWAWGGLHAALVLWPSLLLGWLWQRTASLTACTTAHAAMNALYLFALPVVWRG
jgi:membrane protease YdiL (CAAX protease family)